MERDQELAHIEPVEVTTRRRSRLFCNHLALAELQLLSRKTVGVRIMCVYRRVRRSGAMVGLRDRVGCWYRCTSVEIESIC